MRSIRILRRFTWSCVQEASWEFWALNQFERKSFLAVASYCPSNIIQELTAVFFFFFSNVITCSAHYSNNKNNKRSFDLDHV